MTGRSPDDEDKEGQAQPFPLCAASEDEIQEAKNAVASRAYKDATVELAPVTFALSPRAGLNS